MQTNTAPTYVTGVTVYGNFCSRDLTIANAVTFIESRDDVALILGAMRPGYLGREMLTLDDLRRWEHEDAEAAAWDDIARGAQFDRDNSSL